MCRPLGGTAGQGSRHILTTSGPASIRAALLLEESAVLVRMCSDQASNRRVTGLPESGFPARVELAEPCPRRALPLPLPLPHAQQLGGVLPAPPVRRLRALALMDLAVGREATVRTPVEGVRRPLLAAVRAGLARLSNDGERVATITLHLGVSPSGVRPPGRLRLDGSKPLRWPLHGWPREHPGGARMTADLPAGRSVRGWNGVGPQGTSYARSAAQTGCQGIERNPSGRPSAG